MSYLFIESVSFILENAPSHSIPLLMGILKNENIDTSYINLNLILQNEFKNKQFIKYIYRNIDEIVNNKVEDKKKEKNVILKELISSAYSVYSELPVLKILQIANYALRILKNKFLYNNLFLSNYSYMVLYKALSQISFFYSQLIHLIIPDCDNCRSTVQNRDFPINIELLEDFYDSELNILKEFFDSTLKKSITKDVEGVGISINTPGQFITGLYICKYIKQNFNCHVNIGGSFFNEYYNCITNIQDLFGKYFDSISIKNNTKTVVALVKYLRQQIDISSVPNIIYFDKKININGGENTFNYNKIPYIELGHIDKNDYIIPNLVIPIQASRSCYWAKCIFCDCSSNDEKYTVKSIKRLVDEIEFLKKKYKSEYFYFWDNALHPNYLSRLADELNARKLKIFFSIYARFEAEFNVELFRKLRKAGLLHICWGLDSASKRVIKYIDKGIDLDIVEKVLKESKKSNIYNKVYLILGHPTETLKEIQETVNFVNQNADYIGDITTNKSVYFLQNAIIQKNREFYKSQIKTNEKDRTVLIRSISKNCSGSMITSFSPTCLLYMARYSVKKLFSELKIFNLLQEYKIVRSINLNIYNLLWAIFR